MTDAEGFLRAARSVLVVDWPSRDVPDTLARAGYTVIVKSGPGPDDYAVQELHLGRVLARELGRAPERADLVYAHRPLEELPAIVALAQETGAKAVWRQSGLASAGTPNPRGCWVSDEESRRARDLLESTDLGYVDDLYIADVVRGLVAQEDPPTDVADSRPSRELHTSISPELSVRRGRAAIDFYKAAFGAEEVYRVGGTDDHQEVVAQLAIGSASFWVADEAPANKNFSPESVGGGTVRMLLIVEDPDSALARATTAGAREISPVGEEHGWRLGKIEDPFGHQWEIGKPLLRWPPQDQQP
jgi:PhnB protein